MPLYKAILPRPLYAEMDTCFDPFQKVKTIIHPSTGGQGAGRTGIHEPAMNKGEVTGAFHLRQNFRMTSHLELPVVFLLENQDGRAHRCHKCCWRTMWVALDTPLGKTDRREKCLMFDICDNHRNCDVAFKIQSGNRYSRNKKDITYQYIFGVHLHICQCEMQILLKKRP